MYLNDNTFIQIGLLKGTALGFLYYNPDDDGNILLQDEDDGWEEYNILLIVFFIKITKW